MHATRRPLSCLILGCDTMPPLPRLSFCALSFFFLFFFFLFSLFPVTAPLFSQVHGDSSLPANVRGSEAAARVSSQVTFATCREVLPPLHPSPLHNASPSPCRVTFASSPSSHDVAATCASSFFSFSFADPSLLSRVHDPSCPPLRLASRLLRHAFDTCHPGRVALPLQVSPSPCRLALPCLRHA